MILGSWRHVVRTAHDGLAALEAAAAFEPDVVLLDIDLPRMSGVEVAKRLRSADENVLLVSMSGFGRDQPQLRHSEGFRHYLLKPLELDLLRTILDTRATRPR